MVVVVGDAYLCCIICSSSIFCSPQSAAIACSSDLSGAATFAFS